MAISFTLNGKKVTSNAPPDTPLHIVLRDHFKLTGSKISCGAGICGTCTFHLNGTPARSCILPLQAVADKNVTTIEGLSPNRTHPLQKAFIAEEVPQCGFCQSGQIMHAAALLKEKQNPTRQEIVEYMDGILCRCGTYLRIIRAIERAAKEGSK